MAPLHQSALGGFGAGSAAGVNPFAPTASAAAAAGGAPLPAILAPQQGPSAPKFPTTYYFRRVEVQLDPQQYPGESGRIVWDKVGRDSWIRSSTPGNPAG